MLLRHEQFAELVEKVRRVEQLVGREVLQVLRHVRQQVRLVHAVWKAARNGASKPMSRKQATGMRGLQVA